ncbi:MAG: NifB/NifX family molybdenum-iron cluster-binding protein [Candidatus Odinarchaeia archaeon]
MTKILIPIARFYGEDSEIFPHFGRAPLFAFLDVGKDGEIKEVTAKENESKHFGKNVPATLMIIELKPDVVITKSIGGRAIDILRKHGIKVLTGNVSTIKEAVNAYVNNKLEDVSARCEGEHGNAV